MFAFRKSKGISWRAAWIFSCLALAPLTSFAQSAALQTGTKNAILDEWGKTLEGTNPFAEMYGNSVVEGDYVQILQADYGIFPPDTDGNPHFANAVIYTGRVGDGMSPLAAKTGKFSGGIYPRPSGQIFMRVFNADTIEKASFYADSQLHTVGSSSDSVFISDISQTDQPLDANDDDGDGLNNSWEKSYGSDKGNPDSDGDGISDGDEHITGTDPLDETSKFVVARLRHSGASMLVEWDSVPGKKYVVEFSTSTTLDEGSYAPACDAVTASAAITQCPITNGMENAGVYYRVKKVD